MPSPERNCDILPSSPRDDDDDDDDDEEEEEEEDEDDDDDDDDDDGMRSDCKPLMGKNSKALLN